MKCGYRRFPSQSLNFSSHVLNQVLPQQTRHFRLHKVLPHVTSAANVVGDILMKPQDQDRYQTLKVELMKRPLRSQEEKLGQLFKSEELGDHKPSEFLRHLRNLADGKASEEILRMLWPHAVQVALATQINFVSTKRY